MRELKCGTCGTRVLVEKYSPTHTSVQWQGDAQSSCPEFARRAALGEPSSAIPTCHALRDSIERAVYDGVLETDSPRSYPVAGRLG
ncbi:hypothetical protein ACFYVR_16300 [Rhodococcus sp. NPDC003318]|uniref:hypothetical protein n=1 Tax=Rhodococcus sp. NPDC003318 TaxID=3364503 RepID=UPI0036BBBFC1